MTKRRRILGKNAQVYHFNAPGCLTLKALANGTTFSFSKRATAGDMYFSADGGSNWYKTSEVTIPAVNNNDTVMFVGDMTPNTSSSTYGIGTFSSTGNFEVQGNVMSLLFLDNFSDKVSLSGKNYVFYGLFLECSNLTSAQNMTLPATTLSTWCYYRMFRSCTNLTMPPSSLPATNGVDSCYMYMFALCSNLTTTPTIAMTKNAHFAYMFFGCRTLTETPILNIQSGVFSANSMFNGCTNLQNIRFTVNGSLQGDLTQMFYGCTSLTTIPTGFFTSNTQEQMNNHFRSMFSRCTSIITLQTNLLPYTTLSTTSAYSEMFKECTGLTNVPNLPAPTLTDSCYMNMFYGCTSLVTIPANLFNSVHTLNVYCFCQMFYGCTSLTTLPTLPSATLTTACFSGMFNECRSLSSIPNNYLPYTTLAQSCYQSMFSACPLTSLPNNLLPATTLANVCYEMMFRDCTKLATVPSDLLPATTLTKECYYGMFMNCTSLVTAPDLPATTLVNTCYANMFRDCSKLNYIKAMFTTTPGSSYTQYWVSNVANTGTFVKNSAATWTNTFGSSTIPKDSSHKWTVTTASS